MQALLPSAIMRPVRFLLVTGRPCVKNTVRVSMLSALAASVLFLASACGAADSGQMATLVVTPLTALNINPLPTDASGVQIIARVNDQPITLESFQRLLERAERQQLNIANVAQFQDAVLSVMIEQVLINQAAAERGIIVSDAEVDAELQETIALAGSPEAWNAWLTQNGYSEPEMRESLRDALITGRVRDAIIGDLSGPVPLVHARHILVRDEALANDIISQLASGADFGALAAQYSQDMTSANSGGDLGWFAEDELLQPALAYAAFNSPLNQVEGPIATELGYHVLEVLERRDETVEETRRASLAEARFENWLTSLASSATVERYLN